VPAKGFLANSSSGMRPLPRNYLFTKLD
jgi:hypothetical protein